ncbi:MAG: response regulator transcription factor [Thermoleophilia bacterium]|nr:response regulator transcription factor [Thermoleophilia bacterium]
MGLPNEKETARVNRVALVHHNALLREGLCRILEDGGFTVVWQGGSASDIDRHIQDCGPGVILLEWDAPGVGAPVVQELSALSSKSAVVIITRPDTTDDLSPALDAGAAGCLSVNMSSGDFLLSLRMLAHGDILVSHEMVPVVTSSAERPVRPEDDLTPRELEVLRALGRGATNHEIAEELFISPHTVKIHVRRILTKMEFRNRQQAAAYAASEGLI